MYSVVKPLVGPCLYVFVFLGGLVRLLSHFRTPHRYVQFYRVISLSTADSADQRFPQVVLQVKQRKFKLDSFCDQPLGSDLP